MILTPTSPSPRPNRTAKAFSTRQTLLPANCLSNCPTESTAPRVFIASDLHTDYPANMAWVRSLSSSRYRKDVLIVAGDVAETYDKFVITLSELKERFCSVFFVPGNHDLWCRNEGDHFMDSLEKMNALLDVCSELGVDIGPRVVDGIGIIPLFSWYHQSFDKEKDVEGVRIPSLEMACKDFHACKWPKQLSDSDVTLARYFDMMNENNLSAVEEVQRNSYQIITFSHFLPRPELCPEKRMLFYPNLPKIIGSDLLEDRLRSIHGEKGNESACHVFGHTHFCWDAVHDGIRYVQAPLAYPRERKRRMNGGEDWLPSCIYHQGLVNTISPCFWSEYYSNNKREPQNTNLAPWVARFYRRRRAWRRWKLQLQLRGRRRALLPAGEAVEAGGKKLGFNAGDVEDFMVGQIWSSAFDPLMEKVQGAKLHLLLLAFFL